MMPIVISNDRNIHQTTNMKISSMHTLEAAAKYIPTKIKTKYRVPWETLAVREKRALVKTASKNY